MINLVLNKLIGSKNVREVKRLDPRVAAIGALEPELKKLSDSELAAKTQHFKERISQGASLEDLLHEAFAVVREAGRRQLNMRHFDVQLVGGMVLHQGKIAEMKTGEGKTLVATLPLYLNALMGHGAHLITVNDYLAKRDADWMGKIYRALGLSVGVIYHDMPDWERQKAYRSDITYGQNNEFGFDYLRDNMKDSIDRYAQRELFFAIVDEVDSILIDEARTPLIISGPAEQSADLYERVNRIIPSLKKDVDYTVDEKAHSAMLTDTGVEHVEKKLSIDNLYDPVNLNWLHHVTQALSAHTLYRRDANYLVEDGKVIIIDEHTGRKMPGRRWSDGLHQAIEAKENVVIEEENQTLATITFQNYFRMYNKLAGMTGTAETEAEEFYKIYKLDVVAIPTNRNTGRKDHEDLVYKNEQGKFRKVISEIEEAQKRGQPVLVGTISVEKSEVVSKLLRNRGIKHNVLNAKFHQREAEFVAQAGRKGAVTISTNMAGRGTDIILGGNPEMLAKTIADPETDPEKYRQALEQCKQECAKEREEVVAAGGLHIVGTERHEARRIDNQLRGRSGRQGDPGSSRFYLSLEDDLMRIFGGERIQGLMERMGMQEDEELESRIVTKVIANAQKRVEGHNFDIRKHLLEYDDVMNSQRKTIYTLRKHVLEGVYLPELSDAEKRSGASTAAATSSGNWTVETLGEQLRPRINEIVQSFDNARKELEQRKQEAIANPEVPPQPATLQPGTPGKPRPDKLTDEHLTRELYRIFGARVDLHREIGSLPACVDKATREIAASLIQQRERVLDLCDAGISDAVNQHCPERVATDSWDVPALEESLRNTFNTPISLAGVPLVAQDLAESAWKQVNQLIETKEAELGPMYFLFFARHFSLDEIDAQWIDHLKSMDHLREGIGLRGYGQRDPKHEYKKEGFVLFAEMMSRIQANVLAKLFRVQVQREEPVPTYQHKQRQMTLTHGAAPGAEGEQKTDDEPQKAKTVRRDAPRIGRNDPCPCGSGKKYKNCHMRRDQAQLEDGS